MTLESLLDWISDIVEKTGRFKVELSAAIISTSTADAITGSPVSGSTLSTAPTSPSIPDFRNGTQDQSAEVYLSPDRCGDLRHPHG